MTRREMCTKTQKPRPRGSIEPFDEKKFPDPRPRTRRGRANPSSTDRETRSVRSDGDSPDSSTSAELAPIIARTDRNDVRYRPTSSSRQDRRRLHRQGRQRQVHDGLAPARQQVRTLATRDFFSRGPSTFERGAILGDREPFEGMTSSVDGRARAPHRDRARCDGLFLYSSIPSVDAVRAVASDRAARLRSFNTRARVEALLRAPSSSADRREEEGRGLVVFTSHNS